MLRKRYTVVVVGRGGMALAQRSELSRHRTEREARVVAEEGRERLITMHGDRAGDYRVVVERDGVALPEHEEQPPVRTPSPDARQPPHHEPVVEAVRVIRPAPTVPPDAEVFSDDEDAAGEAAGDTAEQPVPVPPSRHDDPRHDPELRKRVRMPAIDDIPSGKVPDEVLQRFEQAIAREERRRAQRPGPRAD